MIFQCGSLGGRYELVINLDLAPIDIRLPVQRTPEETPARRREPTMSPGQTRSDLFFLALDVPNHGLSAFVYMDVLNPNKLRPAVPQPAQRLHLNCIGAQ
jgi:hypothetical protein